jgi:hypothetical protein
VGELFSSIAESKKWWFSMRSMSRFSRLLAPVSIIAATSLLWLAPTVSRSDAPSGALQAARTALEKYQDPFTAVRDGYFSTVACILFGRPGTLNGMPYPAGAMGVHFINMSLVGKKLDPMHPQVLLYQPLADGTLKLAGAEWFVPYVKGMKPPKLFGQTFYGPMMGHYPLMPSQLVHYDLHVWLWLNNPAGTFMPTNANLKCPKGPYTYTDKTPVMPGMQ